MRLYLFFYLVEEEQPGSVFREAVTASSSHHPFTAFLSTKPAWYHLTADRRSDVDGALWFIVSAEGLLMHHDTCASAGVCGGSLVCSLSRRHTAEGEYSCSLFLVLNKPVSKPYVKEKAISI